MANLAWIHYGCPLQAPPIKTGTECPAQVVTGISVKENMRIVTGLQYYPEEHKGHRNKVAKSMPGTSNLRTSQ